MADNITVRTGEGVAPGVAKDGSAKKSKLDEQVEALGEHIKSRTGRAVDEDVLRAMVLRKQARAERQERAAESQQTFLKTSAQETLQAQKTEDKGTLIGRPREMNTADGLSSHQRQLVTSDPHAPTILPPATHAPITPEAASTVLEKIFSFLKPGSADAAPLTVEHYSETLVPRPPTQPPAESLRSAQEQPQRPLPEGGEHGDLPTDRPTTGRPADRPVTERPTTGRPATGEHPQQTTGGRPNTGGAHEQPTVNRPTTGEGPGEGHPQRPTETGGRPVTPGPGEPNVPRPQTGSTLHLPKKREPTGEQPKTPQHSGATPLGQTMLANARATDVSGRTQLGQTTLASATPPAPTGPTVPTRPGPPSGPNVPAGPRPGTTGGSAGGNVGGPVGGRATRGAARVPGDDANELHLRNGGHDGHELQHEGEALHGSEVPEGASGEATRAAQQKPQRPGEDAGRPVTTDDGEPTVPRPGNDNTVHLQKKREPAGGEPPRAPAHSGSSPLGRTVLASARGTDASGRTPLGETTQASATTTGPTVPTRPGPPTGAASGARPGSAGGNVGGPVGGRTRGATRMPNESSSGGTTLSLRGSRPATGRRPRATDVTTDDPIRFVNNGGGFDTTTSWDGMHFNWEAFFVKFMFQFQKDEAEARRLMKELRNAMHKLAQEGIKAKIALEKMNQAFERAEEAFKLGNAMKGVMDAAMQAGQAQGQGQDGQQQGAQGANGQQTPGAQQTPAGQQTGEVPADQAGAVPRPDNAAGNQRGAQPGQTRDAGPRPASADAADPSADPSRATPTSGDQPTTPGGQQRPGQARARGRGSQQGQGQGQQQEGFKMPGAGLVGNVSEHLRAAMEKANADVISSAQRGASEVDARIRSNYMQAQGLFNQMVQLLAMSRSK